MNNPRDTEAQYAPIMIYCRLVATAAAKAAPRFPAIHPLAGGDKMSWAKDWLIVVDQIFAFGKPVV
jgi:hypothetical protein